MGEFTLRIVFLCSWILMERNQAQKEKKKIVALGFTPPFSINLEPPANCVKCRKFSWRWILMERNQAQKEKNRHLMFHPAVLDKP